MTNTPIGFVGLGNMGSGMVKNLLANNFAVAGCDEDPEKSNISHPSFTSVSAQQIAASCEVVILCLPNPEISREVIFNQLLGDDGAVSTIIETSTLTPEIVTDFSRKLADKDVAFLSTPMIGGKYHAANGTIEFLVEGNEQDLQKVEHVLEGMGKARYMGAVPSATLAKLAYNLSRYANIAVGVETHRLLERYNANIPAVYEFMSEQSLDNFGQVWKEDLKETKMGGAHFQPSQVPKKDLGLLLQMAESQGLDGELIQAIRDTYTSMEAAE